jgi:hypothetical protein
MPRNRVAHTLIRADPTDISMPNFFIHRPNFAWVIAIFIALTGLLALSSLPVAQYPNGGTTTDSPSTQPIPAHRRRSLTEQR